MLDWKAILSYGPAWVAAVNLIGAIVFVAIPTFPKEIWLAIVALVNSILAALDIVQRVRGQVTAARQASLQRAPPAPGADASTLGPNAASVHIGGNIKESNVGAGGRDVRQG